MAQLDKTTYEGKFNSPTTGLFKNNTTKDITAERARTLVTDNKDSFVGIDETLPDSVDTSGGTLTLAFGSAVYKSFRGNASFAGPKTIAHSGDSNAVRHTFSFNITNVAAVLTLPNTYLMSDPRFDGDDWTPVETGVFKLVADFDGTNWIAEILGPYV